MSEPFASQGPSPAGDQSPTGETEAAEEAAFCRWLEQTAAQLAEDLCPPQEAERMLVWVKAQTAARGRGGSVP